jgi:3-hydroxyisobutyrate dehydrogenase-like beta-hydroxyacid dehydrogenase
MGSLAQAEWIASQAAAVDSYIAKPPMPGIVRRNWPVGFAVKHDSRDLGYALADVATQLMTSGELAKITEKYGVTYYAPE